jgi:hypothetical protein
MGMTGRERSIWLSQISRIHFLERQSRQKEWQEYLRQPKGQE